MDEILEIIAQSKGVASAKISLDVAALDAVIIDTLLEKLRGIEAQKTLCPNESFNAQTYNNLLFEAARAIANIRDFECKYDVTLLPFPRR